MRIKAVLLVISMVFTSLTQGQATIDSSRIIKVLSFNILHGANTNGNFDLDVIAKVIRDQAAKKEKNDVKEDKSCSIL